MADKPVISINNLSAFYSKKQVLDGISFELAPGTVTAIAGPNGSGKSTLLSLIANIKIPELSSTADDSITIYNKRFTDYSRKELSRTVAFAPQNSYPAWNNTVYNTIMTGRYAHTNWTDTYTQNDNSVVTKTINTLNLNSLADRNVFSLSGGEYQRVVLARSLAQEPQILLLDEPVSSLDLYYQYLLLETIQNLARTQKLSVLISLHDLNLASIFSDRIILLSEGHLLSDGTAEQVLTPSNLEQIYKQKFIVTDHPTRHKPQVFVE